MKLYYGLELGGMSKGRAEEWPQFKVQHPVPSQKESRMLSLPCKDALCS